ncbi:MAG: sulfatase, partial [Anaerolineae bacterium]
THFLGLRDGEWKYIYDKLTGSEELYCLESDPSEVDNLALSRQEVVSRFRDQLFELLSEHSEQEESEARMSGSDMELVVDRLRGLGYIE